MIDTSESSPGGRLCRLLVILWAINVIFGDQMQFLGPHHGIVPFIVVVIGILFAETAASKIFRASRLR